ncbi:MAG: Polysaccharide pyruvyl transferase family protein WcaK [Pseudonocardiales bacterium]|nr:Polysaccharide pyruvyl transferase family protein WcaK [Pseudonocardiales bacterium]
MTAFQVTTLTDLQWDLYNRQGFLDLGEVIAAGDLKALRERADDLATGRRKNDRVEIQRDTGGRYEDLPGVTMSGTAGDLLYRKIQGLEADDLYSVVLNQLIFADIAARHYGRHAAVSLFRAMVMNKPAGQGTILPWHQDGGDVWALDRDPLVTIWVALDDATVANGCVEVIEGSHRLGLLSPQGSTVREDDLARYCPEPVVRPLEVAAGHGVLMHNWLIHRSGVNPTAEPRRAFTACYMDARTQNVLTGDRFPLVFGEVAGAAHPFVTVLTAERDHYRFAAATATEYAVSLRDDNAAKTACIETATEYARSLERACSSADLDSA